MTSTIIAPITETTRLYRLNPVTRLSPSAVKISPPTTAPTILSTIFQEEARALLVDDLSGDEGRDLGSHAPSIQMYRRMLSVFEPIRRRLTGGELTATQIIDILKAKLHPDHRQRS